MFIEKTAKETANNLKQIFYYDSARTALKKVLSYRMNRDHYTLLLPGYIGFSPKEGSGIYDPVTELGMKHIFYKIDRNLSINTYDLEKKLNENSRAVVLLVHYFGYPDVNVEKIVELCRVKNALIIEDCAHALYTDYIDHCCGSYGDYSVYSIHKMLPYKRGGFLKVNRKPDMEEVRFYRRNECSEYASVFNYDFYDIAQKRKNNARYWRELLVRCKAIDILHTFDSCKRLSITPQTFPVIIKNYDRNKLYFELNSAGYGAVSLYHTMIAPIKEKGYEDAVWLSEHIMNLPVHQDIEEGKIEEMYSKLMDIMR